MVRLSLNAKRQLERWRFTESVNSLDGRTESMSRIVSLCTVQSSFDRPSVAVGRISLSRTLASRVVCRANHGTHSIQETVWQDAGRNRDPIRDSDGQ